MTYVPPINETPAFQSYGEPVPPERIPLEGIHYEFYHFTKQHSYEGVLAVGCEPNVPRFYLRVTRECARANAPSHPGTWEWTDGVTHYRVDFLIAKGHRQ